MAVLDKINANGVVYDIQDTAAQNSIETLDSQIVELNSSIDTLNGNMSAIMKYVEQTVSVTLPAREWTAVNNTQPATPSGYMYVGTVINGGDSVATRNQIHAAGLNNSREYIMLYNKSTGQITGTITLRHWYVATYAATQA